MWPGNNNNNNNQLIDDLLKIVGVVIFFSPRSFDHSFYLTIYLLQSLYRRNERPRRTDIIMVFAIELIK